MGINGLDENSAGKYFNLKDAITQKQFGDLVGISQQAVSGLLNRGVLITGQSGHQWLMAYCSQLREQAAGRMGADGDGDLVTERTRLAKEQADGQALKNAIQRKEYAPVTMISSVLADAGRQIAAILETIPKNIKRQSAGLTAQDYELLQTEIVRARNIAASIEVDLSELDDGSI